MSYRVLGAIVACSLAAACSASNTRPAARTMTTNEGACVLYGFTPGTSPSTTCVQREADAHRRGRMGPDYNETLIARDAQEDCAAYGLARGTTTYELCVQREISYRRPN